MSTRPLALVVIAVLASVAFAAPPAAAHSESVAQGRAVEIGNYTAYLNPEPDVLYANTSNQGFTLQVTRNDVGGFAPDIRANMRIEGPNGYDETLQFNRLNAQYLVANTKLTQRGNHTVTLTLFDDEGEYSEVTDLEVYPDLPFRLQPVDPSLDVMPDTRTTLAYETVDPITLERVDLFDDLTVRIEHWSPDHRTLLDTTDVPAKDSGKGLWKIEHVFPQGHYYLRFASTDGGFNYPDIPLLHTNVLPAYNGIVDEPNDAPAPAVLGALAALAVAAALVAAGRRARR